MPLNRIVALALALVFSSAAVADDRPAKRVLLLAQKPDGHPPGTHEYVPGLTLLSSLLERAKDIETRLVSADEPWSEGIEQLGEADAAVVFLSQGAQWSNADSRRLDALAKLAQRGGGLSTIHWGMGTKDAENIEPFVQLFGGCHGGPDRRFKVLTTTLRPAEPRHAIARGVEALEVREEFYYALKFAKGAPAVEPVMQADIEGQPETVCWAWTRPDGGRSFGFSGLHFHENWQKPEYRRLVVQGVLWTLGRDIPEDGVKLDLSLPE